MPVRVRYSDELYHHGILGQKWGIRRFQNPDGSYTPEGLKRYGRDGQRKKATHGQIKRANKLLHDHRFDTNNDVSNKVFKILGGDESILNSARSSLKKSLSQVNNDPIIKKYNNQLYGQGIGHFARQQAESEIANSIWYGNENPTLYKVVSDMWNAGWDDGQQGEIILNNYIFNMGLSNEEQDSILRKVNPIKKRMEELDTSVIKELKDLGVKNSESMSDYICDQLYNSVFNKRDTISDRYDLDRITKFTPGQMDSAKKARKIVSNFDGTDPMKWHTLYNAIPEELLDKPVSDISPKEWKEIREYVNQEDPEDWVADWPK